MHSLWKKIVFLFPAKEDDVMRQATLWLTVIFLLAAFWAPAAAEELDPVEEAWRAGFQAQFNPDAEGCRYDYGPEGMRNVYCYWSSVYRYRDLTALAPTKPFLSGPHTEKSLDLDNKSGFGHYNPDFVDWMADRLIPAASDPEFKWFTQPVYDRLLRKTARIYFLAARAVLSDPGAADRAASKYRAAVKASSADCWTLAEDFADQRTAALHDRFPEDYYAPLVFDCAVAYWTRRHIDGTADGFRNLLIELLETYDPAFLDAAATPPPDPRDWSDRLDAPIEDPELARFLARLARLIEEHDWDQVLTLFAPDNYRAQRELGIGPQQYIREGLGLGMVDNHLPYRPGDASEWARLNAIERVRLTGIDRDPESILTVVEGRLTLFDGSTRRLTLYLEPRAGGWVLSPPVG
jgi:hypothetical protein